MAVRQSAPQQLMHAFQAQKCTAEAHCLCCWGRLQMQLAERASRTEAEAGHAHGDMSGDGHRLPACCACLPSQQLPGFRHLPHAHPPDIMSLTSRPNVHTMLHDTMHSGMTCVHWDTGPAQTVHSLYMHLQRNGDNAAAGVLQPYLLNDVSGGSTATQAHAAHIAELAVHCAPNLQWQSSFCMQDSCPSIHPCRPKICSHMSTHARLKHVWMVRQGIHISRPACDGRTLSVVYAFMPEETCGEMHVVRRLESLAQQR